MKARNPSRLATLPWGTRVGAPDRAFVSTSMNSCRPGILQELAANLVKGPPLCPSGMHQSFLIFFMFR